MKKNDVLGEFIAHTFFGVMFFLVLASAALLLSWFTYLIGTFEFGRPLVPILTVLEKVILAGDCIFCSGG